MKYLNIVKEIYGVANTIKTVFYGYKTPRCVGIDIGRSAIKMVELMPNSFKIAKYSIKPHTKNLVEEGVINDIEELADSVRKEWISLNPKYSHAAIAIPYNLVMAKELTAPIFKAKDQLKAHLLEILVKELETTEIDFDYILKEQGVKEQRLKVVVVKKERSEEYQAVLQMAAIKFAAIDVEPFAICHLFTKLLQQCRISEQIILLDIGTSKLRIYIFQNGEPLYFNEINVSYYSIGENPTAAGNFEKAISLGLVDLIVSDINKSLQMAKSNLFIYQKIDLTATADIYLFGGNALTLGLITKLQRENDRNIYLLSELWMKSNNLNNHIVKEDFIRLIPALALATWGHKLGTN